MTAKRSHPSVVLAALFVALLAGPSCKRAARGEQPGQRPGDPFLAAEPHRASGRAPDSGPRHATRDGIQTLPGASAPREDSRALRGEAAPRPADLIKSARPGPSELQSAQRRDPKAGPPADDGGKVGFLRLDMPPPPALELSTQGAEPRRELRYLLQEGDLVVWDAEVSQRTELRSEKACGPPDAPAGSLRPPQQTIALSYRLQVASRVSSALPKRFSLETTFRNVRLTLPPGLADQSELMTSLVQSASYVTSLTRTGRVESFHLGKLTGLSMKSMLDRLRSPLGMVQPVLPEPAVGSGATWRQVHRLSLPQPGGKVDAVYVTTYKLTRLGVAGSAATAQLQFSTAVKLDGQVMGEAYQGQGRGQGRVVLDATLGLLRSASGQMSICTSVMGKSSTTHTRYSQTLLDAESKLGKGVAPTTPGVTGPARPATGTTTGTTTGPDRPAAGTITPRP